MNQNEKTNLLNFDLRQLEDLILELDEKKIHARRLYQWIHQYFVTDFAKMVNLSSSLRQKLSASFVVRAPELSIEKASKDGTYKWLLELADNNCIEAVYIPEAGRGTLCISSQVGCSLTCSFCSTARQGYNRNLTVAEIIGQLWWANSRLQQLKPDEKRSITNVVMMGMGEPLLNYGNVVAAMGIMLDDFAYGLSKKRVTLSTSGVVPAIRKLATESDVSLAVSLHAPNDALRDILVPINKKYSLTELMDVCRTYFKGDKKRVVTIEYVMLKGINDTREHAKQLTDLLGDVPCKINLIPFNPFPGTQYECSTVEDMESFKTCLLAAGFNTTIRKTRGDDIDAACGQLVGSVDDRTRRSSRWQTVRIMPSAQSSLCA